MFKLQKPPSVKLLHNVSCFNFARLFPHRKTFGIYFSSSRTEFGIIISNAKYTILKITSDLKIVFFPSSDKCLMRQSFITLQIFFSMSQNFYRPEAVKLICTLNTLIHFVLRSRHFIPQSATLNLFRTPIPAISDLVKLGRSLEKPENKFKSFKANLLELMSFKKNVVSSAYAIFKYSSFSYKIRKH